MVDSVVSSVATVGIAPAGTAQVRDIDATVKHVTRLKLALQDPGLPEEKRKELEADLAAHREIAEPLRAALA